MNSKLILLLVVGFLFTNLSISQELEECISEISGEQHCHLYGLDSCDIPIEITSTQANPNTIITGAIESSKPIKITPGFNKVIILPANHSHGNVEAREEQSHKKTHIKGKIPPQGGRFMEFKKKKQKTIFPNPTNGKIIINLSGKENKLFIYDLYGTLLLKKELSKVTDDNITADLSAFNKGLYLVKLTLENGETIIKTIIKN